MDVRALYVVDRVFDGIRTRKCLDAQSGVYREASVDSGCAGGLTPSSPSLSPMLLRQTLLSVMRFESRMDANVRSTANHVFVRQQFPNRPAVFVWPTLPVVNFTRPGILLH